MRLAVLAGCVLGVLSRVEERIAGSGVAISSDSLWLAVAFVLGTPLRGAVALTVANAAYYLFMLALEPGALLPSPPYWFALGVAGGAFFGTGGRIAAVCLATVVVIETIERTTGRLDGLLP